MVDPTYQQIARDLLNELEVWLESNKRFLRQHGPDILGLDPAREKIRVNPSIIGGVLIHPSIGNPLVLGGMRGRKSSRSKPVAHPLKIDPFAIVHDDPGESVDMAIDWLAMTRVWRSLGLNQPMPNWFRVSAALLSVFDKVGSDPAEYCEAVFEMVDGSVEYVRVNWKLDGQMPNERAPYLLYSYAHRTCNAEILWLAGTMDETRLDLRMLPGKNARQLGLFHISSEIPQTVITSAVGRPLKDLVSSYVTDPHDLEICFIEQVESSVIIMFRGADSLRRCVPVFQDQDIADRFADEVAKLEVARTTLFQALSTSALPDDWWAAFENLMLRGAEAPFSLERSKHFQKVWTLADPMRVLLRMLRENRSTP